ncbi:cadherin-like beta sandwich domain-containing protein [Paenibacillus sp. sgz5001063]|uniref:cadherin-like beta sandwich domain-containing protein n=1 Tax=Paenibacillus sp. sgz5001063 TaxID=3242474 RepID=UPI0036D39ECC
MRKVRFLAAGMAVFLLAVILPWVAKADASDSDATLSSFYQAAGELSPAFSPEITEYTVHMRSSDIGYYAAARPANSGATTEYSMNGSSWTSIAYYTSTGYLATNRGNNIFQFKITSSDNSTTKIYTVQVYYPQTNDADLRKLNVSPGGLSPAFNSFTTGYTLNVPYSASSLEVTAEADDPAASMRINGNNAQDGIPSSVPLNVGSNMVYIDVISQDQSISKTYSLTVTRALPSTNANLSALSVQGLGLTPSFQSGVTSYTLPDVGYDTNITVIPTSSDSTATLGIQNSQGGYDTITTGSTSVPLALSPGDHTIVLKVTAQDGVTEKLYSLNVHRKNNNALLSQLTVSPGGLSGNFSSVINTYTLTDVTSGSLTVTPALSDIAGKIEVSVNGGSYETKPDGQGAAVPLKVGSNTILVKVSAEDSSYSNVYSLIVKRVADTTITPVSGSFDKNASNSAAGHYQDVQAELTLNGNLLNGLKLGQAAVDTNAYSVSGSTLTFHKEYLSTLAAGEYAFELVTDAGSHPVFTIAVKDTTPPVLAAPTAGDAAVTLAWSPVSGATGYKVFASTVPGTYGTALATLGAAADSYTAAGLTNGTTYSFVVKAVNGGGDSEASAEVSATPRTVPSAPVILGATAGDGQATINFTPPADNGGSAITSYEITASPGGSITTGTASPITITGLANGTAYTFTVTAINGAGKSAKSASSSPITPIAHTSGTPAAPVTPVVTSTPAAAVPTVFMYVNGKTVDLGDISILHTNNRNHSILTLDQVKLEEILNVQPPGAKISIEFGGNNSDIQTVELNGQLLQYLQQSQVTISMDNRRATYSIPLQQISWDTITGQLGANTPAAEIRIQIEMAAPDTSLASTAQAASAEHGFTFLTDPLDFSVKLVHGNQTTDLSGFSTYVQRIFTLPVGTDISNATGIVIEPGGTVRHVPTRFVQQEGGYAAVISSLTNSTYAVISHPAKFKDMSSHWAKAAVHDLGARMVLEGNGDGQFLPDREITRAEFAAILVRGLGLKTVGGSSPFTDVSSSGWYSSAVQTAYRHQLINGFEDGTFRPDASITREQAMTMIAQAMHLTGLSANLNSGSAAELLGGFTDADKASAWALDNIAASLQAGLISGRSGTELAPQAHVTRAEVAVMLQRLLQKSGLIQAK